MAPPLAGKPPFATDEPDSVYAEQPKPIPRPRKQYVDPIAPGGPRESAYTAFDSYYTGNNTDSRASGIDNIGQGLMNPDSDDDSASDNDQPQSKKHPLPANNQPANKHHALFVAATAVNTPKAPPPSYGESPSKKHVPPPLKPSSTLRTVKQPQPVVHARPNDLHISQYLEPSTPPGVDRSMARQQQSTPKALLAAGGRPAAASASSHPRQPQPAFIQGQDLLMPPKSPSFHGNMPGSPLSPTSRTPQPLPPPPSPITPIFARPRKELTFEEKAGILRGDSEETLLPRGAGGKGDDFWRRFSMVAKEDARHNSQKSAWLTKTESGSTRLAAWVWVVGIVLLIALGGGIGVGWYFAHNKPPSQPVAIGGSADETLTITSSTNAATSQSIMPTKVTAAPVPTNTSNSRRGIMPLSHRRAHVRHIGD